MLATYPAILRGNRLEWGEASPLLPGDAEGVPVYVIILKGPDEATGDRGAQMADILGQLAAAGGIKSIPDPSAWQREVREDRQLPGRDE